MVSDLDKELDPGNFLGKVAGTVVGHMAGLDCKGSAEHRVLVEECKGWHRGCFGGCIVVVEVHKLAAVYLHVVDKDHPEALEGYSLPKSSSKLSGMASEVVLHFGGGTDSRLYKSVVVAAVGRAKVEEAAPEDRAQVPEEDTDNLDLHTGKLQAVFWDPEPLHV
jgi:hypothetical protein